MASSRFDPRRRDSVRDTLRDTTIIASARVNHLRTIARDTNCDLRVIPRDALHDRIAIRNFFDERRRDSRRIDVGGTRTKEHSKSEETRTHRADRPIAAGHSGTTIYRGLRLVDSLDCTIQTNQLQYYTMALTCRRKRWRGHVRILLGWFQ